MIFAAGLGTRLRPITNSIPKALVEVNGITMLEHTVRRLKDYGFNEIIINVHYHAAMVREFLIDKHNFGIDIEISDETGLLLDTGGGLKKAGWFFNDDKPFLLHNVDILTDLDLRRMYAFHVENNSLATLAVEKRDSSRKLLFSNSGTLCKWVNKKTGEEITARKESNMSEFSFCGIHVVSPEIFPLIHEKGVFSIIPLYLRLASSCNINYYYNEKKRFIDIGTPELLNKAQEFFL